MQNQAAPSRTAGIGFRHLLKPDLIVSIAVAGFVASLNYHASAMEGILPCYLDFKRIILAGFDPSAARHGTPTFPMWGYGWLLLLSENHSALIAIQLLLALFASQCLFNHIHHFKLLSPRAESIGRWVMAFNLPWYAFHSVRWPYSIAISLFVLSIVAIDRGLRCPRPSIGWAALSGALFGIVLNFRSDYYLMPVGLAIVIVGVGVNWQSRIQFAGIWLAVIYAMLIPWATYTHHVTGRASLTSTNSGHVMFIGLGNLPGNCWGITPRDEDPLMRQIVTERFGPGTSTVLPQTDRFLKQQFLLRVSARPDEYLRKCAYAALAMIARGPYCGEFLRQDSSAPPSDFAHTIAAARSCAKSPLSYLSERGFSQFARLVLMGSSFSLGWMLVALSTAISPYLAWQGWRRSNYLLVMMQAAYAYQAAIQILVGTMAAYTANLLFLHLLNLLWASDLLRRNATQSAAEVASSDGLRRIPPATLRRAA